MALPSRWSVRRPGLRSPAQRSDPLDYLSVVGYAGKELPGGDELEVYDGHEGLVVSGDPGAGGRVPHQVIPGKQVPDGEIDSGGQRPPASGGSRLRRKLLQHLKEAFHLRFELFGREDGGIDNVTIENQHGNICFLF